MFDAIAFTIHGAIALALLIGGILYFRRGGMDLQKKALLATVGVTLAYGLFCYLVMGALSRQTYGYSALCLAPFINGIAGVLFYHWFSLRNPGGVPRPSLIRLCLILPSITTLVDVLLLFAFFFEGGVCILMIAPLLWLCTIFGAFAAYAVVIRFRPPRTFNTVFCLGLVMLLPLGAQPLETALMHRTESHTVTTRMIVHAPPERVFPNLTRIPAIPTPVRLSSPDDLLFLLGMPAPTESILACDGLHCARKCVFTQHVWLNERVTAYDPGRELAFDILTVVGPQSRWSGLDAHLMPGGLYFDNRKGRFRLTRLANGDTLVEGTTWYTLHSSMNGYGNLWAGPMIHAIHHRVFNRVRALSEAPGRAPSQTVGSR